jgi:hypothetical protein
METFVGDTIIINLSCGIDLSGYADLIIKFQRPNESMGFWTATLDPLDNTHMFYQTDDDDLNMSGTWVVQSHVEDPNLSLHGLWATFTVYDPLAETSTPPTTIGPTTTP